MAGFWKQLWEPWNRWTGRAVSTPRRRRRYQVEVSELDPRLMLAAAVTGAHAAAVEKAAATPKPTPGVTGFNATAVPNVLLPPNGQFVLVTVSGQVVANTTSPPSGFFYVTDEYREIEPRGVFKLGPGQPFVFNGTPDGTVYPYSFTIYLQAQRSTNIPDGRHYYILVGAKTPENTMSTTVPVIVPIQKLPPEAQPILYSTIQAKFGFKPKPHTTPTPPTRATR